VSYCIEMPDHMMLSALRFDGYAYLERELGDDMQAIDLLNESNILSEDENLNFATCFFLQRYLCKWGGERECEDSQPVQRFKQLSWHLWEKPVPPEYAMWAERFARGRAVDYIDVNGDRQSERIMNLLPGYRVEFADQIVIDAKQVQW
jgi:hypothetical protein